MAGDEAVISYNAQTGAIIGTLHTHTGRAFALEECGGGYIFREFDVASFPTEEDMVRDGASEDNNGLVTATTKTEGPWSYSLMLYYTPEFAASFTTAKDMEIFFEEMMAITNQAQLATKTHVCATFKIGMIVNDNHCGQATHFKHPFSNEHIVLMLKKSY